MGGVSHHPELGKSLCLSETHPPPPASAGVRLGGVARAEGGGELLNTVWYRYIHIYI